MSADREHGIDEILEKYFAGETSLSEEEQLRTYFQGADVHPDHTPYRSIFAWAGESRSIQPSPYLTERILQQLPVQTTPARVVPLRRVLAVAAAIAVIAVAGWWFFFRSTAPVDYMADTYSDPQEALAQVQAALALVSQNLEHGQEITRSSLTQTQELDVFSVQ